jgi:hypothetical protein
MKDFNGIPMYAIECLVDMERAEGEYLDSYDLKLQFVFIFGNKYSFLNNNGQKKNGYPWFFV